MKFVWVIAIILAILFGFSVALNFLGALWIGAVVLLVAGGIFMAVMQFIAGKFGSALGYLAAAAFFGWILSFWF